MLRPDNVYVKVVEAVVDVVEVENMSHCPVQVVESGSHSLFSLVARC